MTGFITCGLALIWALIVSLKEGDGSMVKEVAKNERAKLLYRNVVIPDRNLIRELNNTRESFPLQSFADLVRIDHTYDWRANQGSHNYNKKIADSGKK